MQLSHLTISLPYGIYDFTGDFTMDHQNVAKLVNDEIEQQLDAVLFKIETLLEPDEIALIRWACGKSAYTTSKENHVSDSL
jgi:hypothetical protein